MSKRKKVVNDIIYELDNEDIESSEDEKVVKKRCEQESLKSSNKIPTSDDSCIEVIDMALLTDDSLNDDDIIVHKEENIKQNGGKIEEETVKTVESDKNKDSLVNNVETITTVVLDDSEPQILTVLDDSEPQILTDDIIINSPDSNNSSNAIVGCVNRTPLVSVRFKNKRMAKCYKEEVKRFMLKLMRLHDEEHTNGSENESDLELDIWPEDLVQTDEEPKDTLDSLFFVDTAPCAVSFVDVPQYSKVTEVLSDIPKREPTPPPTGRRGPMCFNCDGSHPLRDCTKPRNNIRIAEKRKAMNANRVGRYHVEDDQKYGHLVPGRISGPLRHALGLKRDELPMFIYRMRLLGYPPGWLEEARILHSGINMFDSAGKAIQEPDDEEGEICEPGSKDTFDIRKIHDYPGFNVPASSRYKEQAHMYNLPPMSERDSKLCMLQALAPNAMKAYKKKKLLFFPSGSPDASLLEGQAEMELDDGDETPEFPTIPPLPDEAPPAAPPPPPPLPPSPPMPLSPGDIPTPPLPDSGISEPSPPRCASEELSQKGVKDVASDSTEATDAALENDDAGPMEDEERSQTSLGRDSPSLADLEEKKRLLLEALDSGLVALNSPESSQDTSQTSQDMSESVPDVEEILETTMEIDTDTPTKCLEKTTEIDTDTPTTFLEKTTEIDTVTPQTPTTSTGRVKSTHYGTPILNTATPYLKLPSDDKFAKDICSVLNFENLPDSTGKYEKICSLLKRVKSEVDRIQES